MALTGPAAVDVGLRDAGAAACGPLDILVSNARAPRREPMLQLPVADWRRLLDANLTSAFIAGRAAARRMVERGYGKIINVW